jgi:hypothetical protein
MLGLSAISWVSVPDTPDSSGSVGQFAVDDDFIYICTATNTWDRVAKDTSNWSTV